MSVGAFPTAPLMAEILLRAGWRHPAIIYWDSPDGKRYTGLRDAWVAHFAPRAQPDLRVMGPIGPRVTLTAEAKRQRVARAETGRFVGNWKKKREVWVLVDGATRARLFARRHWRVINERRPRRGSDEVRELLPEMRVQRNAGATFRAIAKNLGISHETVRRSLRNEEELKGLFRAIDLEGTVVPTEVGTEGRRDGQVD